MKVRKYFGVRVRKIIKCSLSYNKILKFYFLKHCLCVKVSSNFDPDYDNATRQPQTRTERVPVWF